MYDITITCINCLPAFHSLSCKNLAHLSLSYCEHVSDSGIELLSQLRSLVDLDVTGCVSLTDQASLHPNSDC